MKLSAYACSLGVSDRTAWRWFKAGKVAGFQADTGAILVTEAIVEAVPAIANPKTVIHTRVSAAENQDHLEGQAKRRMDYCAAKGYPVAAVVKEIGSGVNDTRPKLLKWLTDPTVGQIGMEPKDRLTRFGFNYIEPWLAMQGRKTERIRAELQNEEGHHPHQARPG
jgi:putative resolvase